MKTIDEQYNEARANYEKPSLLERILQLDKHPIKSHGGTIAPWKISGTSKTEIVIHSPTSKYGPIAFISSREGDKEETEANAKLIASAPELLEACEIMELAFKNAPSSWLMTAEVQNASIYMREIIAKAKS